MTGVKYIEERRYQYDPAKGYNVLLSSRRTGEKILEGETVDNPLPPQERSQPNAAQTADALSAKTNPCRGSGLDSSMPGQWPDYESSVRRAYASTVEPPRSCSLSLSTWSLRVKTVHNVEAWQCEHDLPYEAGLSEDICYDLFHELGLDESGSQVSFRELARTAGKRRTAGHRIRFNLRIPSTATA